ncbi:hypothetical protein BIV25_06370 [Streptomyces sp. MUSC 14]|uniref:DUF885 domain-containing protein n=1 Tax=Streptomyces sp. MUSC 14 TaxID=1354889 RepID=UPI0008F5F6DF|nr:DUF885 domain-containing protein [Streptomyces sp. MUSC 14]OIK00959.1 hypothetical protein BIV25_06370 [Streptomyces sp. MUSC 14]
MADEPSTPSTPSTPRRIADDHVAQVAALDPVTSTRLGLHPGDDRQADLSPEGFEALADVARRTLAALDAAERYGEKNGTVWADAERNCARLLRERLTAELALHEAGDQFRQLRNVNSPLHQVRGVFTLMPTGTDENWAAVAGRLRHVPDALDGYRATLSEGIARGLLCAPRQVTAVLGQLAAWTGQDGGGAGWFAAFVAAAPDRLRPGLDAAAERATGAVADFRDWLRGAYLPAADGTPDPVGRERYLRAARWAVGAAPDPAEAYAWAWEEFHRTRAEMRAEAARILPGADVRATMDHLDRHGHTVTGEENIRAWLQQITDEAIDALDGTHFDLSGPIRRVETRIAPAGSSGAPYYTGPSLDFSRPGYTYLPTLGQQTFPTWEMVSTWYHEGVPGHHLQTARWTAEADRLSTYQITLGAVSADKEGWALYAERLMDELGFLTDPARRLGYLDKQMLRIIRVIIDIGMHLELTVPAGSGFHPGERWTPELATAFMAAHHGSGPARRTSEIDRYLGWPGQAIGYKLGERAWLQGREAARRRLGTAFDLRAWHTKALTLGSLGLTDLAETLASL